MCCAACLSSAATAAWHPFCSATTSRRSSSCSADPTVGRSRQLWALTLTPLWDPACAGSPRLVRGDITQLFTNLANLQEAASGAGEEAADPAFVAAVDAFWRRHTTALLRGMHAHLVRHRSGQDKDKDTPAVGANGARPTRVQSLPQQELALLAKLGDYTADK